MEPDKLHSFKAYGESVLQGLDSVLPNQSLQEDWVPASLPDCLQRLSAAAKKTVEIASSPVKIGVMGEFNAGKTLVLGSLIGYADALPVSETPTTGNVTAIHLVQQESLQTTQVNNFTVEYLDIPAIKECLSFMLQEAERRARAAGLSNAQLATLLSLNSANAEVWDSILQWSEQAWKSTTNLELRYLLRELVLFVRTYSAYGTAICGQKYQINASTAREGLKLADPVMEIQNVSFDSLPPAPIKLQNPPQNLSVKFLQNSFPLIRRIDVFVKLSQEIWDLSPLQGTNEFVLLDFPGLGAANSGVRDTFLSLRELAEVQTILILLNGKSPGSDRANQIFTMMQQHKGQDLKDRILVGVGRFDQLPLENEGGQRVLDELINTEVSDNPFDLEPLTEATVLQKLNVLRTTIASAQAFTTQKDRIVLLSPLLGLADQANRWSTVQAGSQEFLANLGYAGYLDRSKLLREKWERLSERLLENDPSSILGRQLGYFAQNGGISRLRESIQNHVANHGLKQLYDDTRRAASAMSREQQNLNQILQQIQQQGIPTAESPAFISLRETINKLLTTYREFQKDLGKQPLQDRRQVPVSDVVYEELTFRIFNWSQWNLFFQRAENGIIKLPTGTNVLDEAMGWDLDKAEDNGIPTQSDDFYPGFEQTVKEMEIFVRDRIRQAITDLLNNLSAKVHDKRDAIAEILPADKVGDRIEHIRKKYGNARLLQILVSTATNPNRLQEYILNQCAIQDNSPSTINPENLFPLARKDDRHKSGQIFDWAPDRRKVNQRSANNQILVLRLRDEMIASAGVELVQLVSEANQRLNNTLRELLNQLIDALQNLLKNEALLRDIATEDLQGNGSTPTWLQTISHIALIPYPDTL